MFRDRQGRMREKEERQEEREKNVSHLEDPRKNKTKIGDR